MKKFIAIIVMFFIMISWTFAYDATEKDTKFLNTFYKKVDKIWKKSPAKVKKLALQIDSLKEKYKSKERTYFLLSEIVKYINNKYNTIQEDNISSKEILWNTFSTIWRNWEIHNIKVFDDKNIYVSEWKKLVWLDLSYTNTLSGTYNFPWDYSVFVKFKDTKWFEYIWEDKDYIATSLKNWIIKNWETRRWWVFIELDNNVEIGTLNFTYINNWVEKLLYKNVSIPKVEKKVEEIKEKTLNVWLNEKFQLDWIEYEITKVWTSYDLGNSYSSKVPNYNSFLIVEYSYKNINNNNDYSWDLKLQLWDYIYDESSTVTSFWYNKFNYYWWHSSKVIKWTKRDTYTWFDIRNQDLDNAVLMFEWWATNDDYKVFIPLKKILNK